MKIVIGIPEEYRKLYETEKCKSKFDSIATNEFGFVLRKAFENGTPLTKGHGRLIDADELCEGRVSNDPVVIDAKCAPTIIEADRGGGERR